MRITCTQCIIIVVKKEKLKEWALTGNGLADALTQKKNNFMENVNSKIELILQRLDFLESEVKRLDKEKEPLIKKGGICAPLFSYKRPENTENGKRK